jgi:hypothetical protein
MLKFNQYKRGLNPTLTTALIRPQFQMLTTINLNSYHRNLGIWSPTRRSTLKDDSTEVLYSIDPQDEHPERSVAAIRCTKVIFTILCPPTKKRESVFTYSLRPRWHSCDFLRFVFGFFRFRWDCRSCDATSDGKKSQRRHPTVASASPEKSRECKRAFTLLPIAEKV